MSSELSSWLLAHPSTHTLHGRCRRWNRLAVVQRFHIILKTAAHTRGVTNFCNLSKRRSTRHATCAGGSGRRQRAIFWRTLFSESGRSASNNRLATSRWKLRLIVHRICLDHGRTLPLASVDLTSSILMPICSTSRTALTSTRAGAAAYQSFHSVRRYWKSVVPIARSNSKTCARRFLALVCQRLPYCNSDLGRP